MLLTVACTPWLWLIVWGGAVLASVDAAPARKLAFIQSHALYGKTILRSDLPALRRLVVRARSLPRRGEFGVAYMIQGEEDSAAKELAMWGKSSDVFVLTFRTRRSDALFFPNSRLGEGRNVLLAAAASEELRRGFRYTYYTFLDADTEVAPPWPVAVEQFESFLREWEPAVGLPAYESFPLQNSVAVSTDVFNFDHIFLAIHTEAASALLPYDTRFDQSCWWVSQWITTKLALAFFRNHVLLLTSVIVRNPTHSTYNRNACWAQMTAASRRLQDSSPTAAKSCFAGEGRYEVVWRHDTVRAQSYLPWGVAQKRGQGLGLANYSGANLARVASCDGEDTARAVQQPIIDDWCRGCDVSGAVFLSKKVVARDIRLAEPWNNLGVWLGRFGHNVEALACFAITRRILQRQGRPSAPEVDENEAEVRARVAGERGVASALPSEARLWEHEGKMIFNVAATVLQSPERESLVEAEDLRGLMRHLLWRGDRAPRHHLDSGDVLSSRILSQL
eukprot:TRINITY_DN10889_c0_g2_i1.p1 TRINITY_DN10889_c0_g2~~TRINITY_DN10889_c0_g2_i1.p1  ORF type:complete len:506 (-),score=68.54 TRINITY_DN10889_c0_g2_i1:167-1684(-)